MNDKIYDVKIVKERIRHYCAVMDRCQFQVITKLKSYGVSDSLADEILIELIQNKYLDEERFARSFCSGKFKIKRWGRKKIAFELSKLKVPKSCISLAMLEIDDADYKDIIKYLANKKMALLKDKNIFVRKKKVVNYLITKLRTPEGSPVGLGQQQWPEHFFKKLIFELVNSKSVSELILTVIVVNILIIFQ